MGWTLPLRRHTDDPNECWCEPAVLLSPEHKIVVHRWMFRDQLRVFWYNRFGWPLTRLDPIVESVRRVTDEIEHVVIGGGPRPQFH